MSAQQNKHLCTVLFPIPLITWNWWAIWPVLALFKKKKGLDRHGLQNLCQRPFPGICYLQPQLHGIKNRISPICWSSHALLYFHASHTPKLPNGGANLLQTWLLDSSGRRRSRSIPGLRWCAMQSASTGWWLNLVLVPCCQQDRPILRLL